MKKNLLLIMAVFGSLLSNAQWVSLNAPDSINYLNVEVHPDGQQVVAYGYVYDQTTFVMRNYFAASGNAGSSWTVHPAENVMDLFWYGNAIYMRTITALKKSTDLAASFEQVISPVPGWGKIAVAANGNLMDVNDQWDTPNYSTDGGYTWQSGTGTTPDALNSFLVASSGTLLTGSQSGIYYSNDNGISWTKALWNGSTTWPALERKSICQLADGTLFELEGNTFGISTDGGLNWTAVTTSSSLSTMVDMNSIGGSLVGLGVNEIYTSTNQGSSFTNEFIFNTGFDLEVAAGYMWNSRQFGIYRKLFGTAAVGELAGEVDLVVYPNPASDKVFVQLTGEAGKIGLEVYDSVGNLVHLNKQVSGASNIQIDIQEWPAGVYLIKAGSISKRFVKQ